jgi:hypothetical protein
VVLVFMGVGPSVSNMWLRSAAKKSGSRCVAAVYSA